MLLILLNLQHFLLHLLAQCFNIFKLYKSNSESLVVGVGSFSKSQLQISPGISKFQFSISFSFAYLSNEPSLLHTMYGHYSFGINWHVTSHHVLKKNVASVATLSAVYKNVSICIHKNYTIFQILKDNKLPAICNFPV